MRKIKFRIWDNLTNEMYYDALVGNCRGESTVPCVYLNEVGWTHTDNCVVEQFTGLYDKNGTEIYEGDILYFDLYKTSINNRVVKFKKSMFTGELLRNSYAYPIDEIEVNEHIVIGNIHDNPELIGETK